MSSIGILLEHKIWTRAVKFVMLSALLITLTACHFENKPPADTPPPPTPTLAQQIKTFEGSGAYPKLDQSNSIKGPDQNLNGVRDDIDAWIAAQPITEQQKRASTQLAAILQKNLSVDLNDKVALQAMGDEGMLASACLFDAYLPNYEESTKMSRKIESMTANTRERSLRYMQYNSARSGSSTQVPTNRTCP